MCHQLVNQTRRQTSSWPSKVAFRPIAHGGAEQQCRSEARYARASARFEPEAAHMDRALWHASQEPPGSAARRVWDWYSNLSHERHNHFTAIAGVRRLLQRVLLAGTAAWALVTSAVTSGASTRPVALPRHCRVGPTFFVARFSQKYHAALRSPPTPNSESCARGTLLQTRTPGLRPCTPLSSPSADQPPLATCQQSGHA